MSIFTKSYDFGINNCIGCDKPLNKWNKYMYHNKKCYRKYINKITVIDLKSFVFYQSGKNGLKKVKGLG